jgi:hypothetical protein
VRLVVHALAVDAPALARKPAEEDVLGQRQLRQEPDLLVDEHHARGERVAGGRGGVGQAVDGHRPGVGPVHPGDGRVQRGLARAVLADQADDLAVRHGEAMPFNTVTGPKLLVSFVQTRPASLTAPP